MLDLPGIIFNNTSSGGIIETDDSYFAIPYYKDAIYLSDLPTFIKFIKGVEATVRKSTLYKKYISYIKEIVGLTYCQVLSNITDEMASIEMHHGPILTLFDTCAIITDHILYNTGRVSTALIANIVMEEHKLNNVQIVTLSKTVHEQVGINKIFINQKQAFGDISKFLKKYKYGLTEERVKKINDYIELSKKYDSTDNGVLDLEKIISPIQFNK